MFAFEYRLRIPLDIQVGTMFTWMPSKDNFPQKSARHWAGVVEKLFAEEQ
jgi:hypothetical protein